MTDQTEIEREALALWNKTRIGTFALWEAKTSASFKALYHTVELLHAERAAHEATKAELAAFKQEVSDAIERYEDMWRKCTPSRSTFNSVFTRFITPPPDPITEWLHASGYEGNAAVEQAVRAYAKENDNG